MKTRTGLYMDNVRLTTKNDILIHRAMTVCSDTEYAYGAKGLNCILTKEKLEELAKNNPKMYTKAYKEKTARNIGQRVIDCSGLVCALWEIPDIGSYQLADLPNTNPDEYCEVPLTGLKVGDCVWREGHVAIVHSAFGSDVGVFEAKGVDYGAGFHAYEIGKWKKGIRKKSLHRYEVGWHKDNIGYWYAYGTAKGEYLRGITLNSCQFNDVIPDPTALYVVFDDNGYAKFLEF